MKYSKLFGKSLYGKQSGSEMISHQLLTKGGFIAESSAGRYYFLPLGWRVYQKIKKIIKEEMDKAGAQEMICPVLHPLELWQETNRDSSVGFELMTIEDRRGAKFALGGTAEEMFVDLVRKYQLSYKDLPFNIYQFSTKFRDELRARGGLLRVREFTMKDAYSFHQNEADFKKEYDKMAKTYHAIFNRLELESLKIEADNGYIGGEYCHEFQVEHELGEGRFFISKDGQYTAHEDVAKFHRDEKNVDEKEKKYQEVEARRGHTMEDGAKFHKLPLWQQIKDVMFKNENDELILAIIRGDLDVNETKLKNVSGSFHLEPATEEEIKAIGSYPGFISPVGLEDKVRIIADLSIKTIKNAYGGANKKYVDALNINFGRDYQVDQIADIGMAQDGFLTEDQSSVLIEKRGVEVGNIFQLGLHYTEKMKNATFVNEKGQDIPFYMGCYGIGIGRTLATIVEKHHDDNGIIWPSNIAPYQVHLITLPGGEEKGEKFYQKLLSKDIEVLWDDREESAGKKFADADLIGNPIRLVISKKTGDKIEFKYRDQDDFELFSPKEVIDRLQ